MTKRVKEARKIFNSLQSATSSHQVHALVTKLGYEKRSAQRVISRFRNERRLTRKTRPKSEVFALFDHGLSNQEVFEKVGRLTIRTIQTYRSAWRRKFVEDLPKEVIEVLRAEAKSREITTHELVNTLLTTIVEDNLFHAVLEK